VETLQVKTRLYSLTVEMIVAGQESIRVGMTLDDMNPAMFLEPSEILDLNEWEETMILVSLLTTAGEMTSDPETIWLKHRFALMMRIYPYVAKTIFQAAPAWLKDL